jgi:hypothetical protein
MVVPSPEPYGLGMMDVWPESYGLGMMDAWPESYVLRTIEYRA